MGKVSPEKPTPLHKVADRQKKLKASEIGVVQLSQSNPGNPEK